MTLSRVFLLLLLLQGCNQYKQNEESYIDLATAEKNSCYFNIDSKGNLVSWAPQNQISFQFDLNFPEEHIQKIKDIASTWRTTNGTPIISISSTRKASSSTQNDGSNVIYWIQDAKRFNANEQARTVVRWKNAQIIDADIIINAESFQYFYDPPSSGFKVHAPSLLVHEFGHALGLRHIPITASLMYAQLGYLQIRTEPNEIDIKSMRCEY